MKKIIVIFFLIFLTFILSCVVSAEAFPNTAVNLIKPSSGTRTVSGVTFTYRPSSTGGEFTINGTATADISFQCWSGNVTNSDSRKLYILYGGTDDSRVKVTALISGIENVSGKYPVIFSLPTTGVSPYACFIVISKGTVLNNVKVAPVLAEFNYTVYPYGTDISGQTDTYYQSGFLAGKEEGYAEGEAAGLLNGYAEGFIDGKHEGESQGYESGKTEGYELGVNAGYKFGKTEGYELGANNGELVGYIDGYKMGYTNYKNSTDYVNALNNKYNAGFNEGASSIEVDSQVSAFIYLIPMIIFYCIILVCLIVLKSRKRRKNK